MIPIRNSGPIRAYSAPPRRALAGLRSRPKRSSSDARGYLAAAAFLNLRPYETKHTFGVRRRTALQSVATELPQRHLTASKGF
jgi:hypothetical protein